MIKNYAPVKENDWQGLNMVLEEIFYSNKPTYTYTSPHKSIEVVVAKTIDTIEPSSIPIQSMPTNHTPLYQDGEDEEFQFSSMDEYVPSIIALDKALKVDWSTWAGYGEDGVSSYSVYCSTTIPCPITSSNLVASDLKANYFIIRNLIPGTTYDVRVVVYGKDGSLSASN